MKAEILSVGTELLLGDILNTNARYIARRLADVGIFVYYQSVVGDNPERLKGALKLAFSRADLVITTGGLGPTNDDLTKEIAAEYFGKKLVLHEPSLKKIEEYFAMSRRPMTESNRKQAYFPEGAVIFPNNHGTAPGCIIDEDGRIIVLLPGPPREMEPMFEGQVIPYLQRYSKGALVSRVLRVAGIGESLMTEKVRDLIDAQSNPTIAPYAKEGEAILRITASGMDKEECERLIEPVEEKLRERLRDNVYGIDDDTLENAVARIIMHRNMTVSTAESCTGGLLAGRLINCAGISSVFLEGAVTYSNEAKMKRLNVSEDTLRKFGAVSAETAGEMARGIAVAAGTDIGISTTGIAGPDGGTEQKPVGLVYVGLYIKGNVKTIELRLTGDRQHIRNLTVIRALDFLRRELIANS
jgi:competence/damage-inducible protein CinA C-terminal domain